MPDSTSGRLDLKASFSKPLNLTINPDERWAVTGPRKNDLLSVIGAKNIPFPPLSRTYPFIKDANVWPSQVIQQLEFKGSVLATHLSARYEHFRDEFDQPLTEYLAETLGNKSGPDSERIVNIMKAFKLEELKTVGPLALATAKCVVLVWPKPFSETPAFSH